MTTSKHLVLCNGARPSDAPSVYRRAKKLFLEYRPDQRDAQNLEVGLPQFVGSLLHIPDRTLDLLEIAAYVFGADRLLFRGRKDALVYHAWGRDVHFVIRVRDSEFWNQDSVKHTLAQALVWSSGDRAHSFTFVSGHSTPAAGLFDSSAIEFPTQSGAKVALFSGGIDSLAGAVSILESLAPGEKVYLVSHRSSPDAQYTQTKLLNALENRYPDRIIRYAFICRLRGVRGADETQRMRSFLFTAIAYALATTLNVPTFSIFENGVTSLNLPKREAMGLARASRTTHPRTIRYFERLLTLHRGADFVIQTPFFWRTKTDVLTLLKTAGADHLLDSSVSCTRTFKNLENRTHCGACSQCVDRRFASVAAGLAQHDHAGLYSIDILRDPITDGEARTYVIDHLFQAREFAVMARDAFDDRYAHELAATEEYLPASASVDGVDTPRELCKRHGVQTMDALRLLNDPTIKAAPGTLTEIVNMRHYLKGPAERLREAIVEMLERGIPLAFQARLPCDERDFNDKVDAILNARKSELEREHPCASFARAKVIPDHGDPRREVVIESKYIRGATTPSKVTDGLAADLFKLPPDLLKLLVVYDPGRSIHDVDAFCAAFESRSPLCQVLVIR